MVSWHKENIERLIAALLLAHPELNLNYRKMAVYFGQDASYDSIHNQFRRFRRTADEMQGALGQAAPSTPIRRRNATPSTPRSGRGAIVKPTSAQKASNYNKFNIETPTRKAGLNVDGNIHDPIILDDDDDEDNVTTPIIKHEKREVKHDITPVKEEAKPEEIISMNDMFSAAGSAEIQAPQHSQHESTAPSENAPQPSDPPSQAPGQGLYSMPFPSNRRLFFEDDEEEIIV
ncbi:hypothetical protein MGYG_03832 [Nannizzia gypsea CBS 118893]|uniref:Uncharacterized protein n=1 Tax=Arthroderma gypseum (strain ATCC MYA-4604 / CBS 118893) TaxID=535722 RepID=E4UU61_ARTGP|nr:hypothetical protein MGYG_03832 [Nannizzia gypsea CBS 118893]EFR00828.1 hypothetical protein MGYG_03832 [Nannizzia gypsea CBS 118893]